jgi:hypothetical protein
MSVDATSSQTPGAATDAAAPARCTPAGPELKERKDWAEITCAMVLALATTASAWCVYQSSLWSGVQTFRLAEANDAGRLSAKSAVAGLQIRAFDGTMYLHYLEARAQGHKDLEALLSERFRPEMKVAMEAWLRTNPLISRKAPLHPFMMSEYKLSEEDEAIRQSTLQQERLKSAQTANRTSDSYVLLTVMFASVLFFGGIAGTVRLSWLRQALGALAVTLFTVTFTYLMTMPFCRE